MKRTISLSLLLLAMLTLSATAEEVQLHTTLPGDAGTIALQVTLHEPSPAVFENSSGLPPNPEPTPPAAVPEPATLGLVGLGILGLLAASQRRNRR